MADDDSYRSLSDTVAAGRKQSGNDDDSRTKKGRALSSGIGSMGKHASDRAEAISSTIRPVPYKRGGKIRKKSRKAKGRRKSR